MQCEVLELLQIDHASRCRVRDDVRAYWLGGSVVLLCQPCRESIAEWWGEIPLAETQLSEAERGDYLPTGQRIEYVVQGDRPAWVKVYFQAPRGGLASRQLPANTPVMRARRRAA